MYLITNDKTGKSCIIFGDSLEALFSTYGITPNKSISEYTKNSIIEGYLINKPTILVTIRRIDSMGTSTGLEIYIEKP